MADIGWFLVICRVGYPRQRQSVANPCPEHDLWCCRRHTNDIGDSNTSRHRAECDAGGGWWQWARLQHAHRQL